EFASGNDVGSPGFMYAGGYVRGALLARIHWVEVGINASYTATPSQRIDVDSHRASGPSFGMFAGVGGFIASPEPPRVKPPWRWGAELRGAPTTRNAGSENDAFPSDTPPNSRFVGYNDRPTFDAALTLERDPNSDFLPMFGVSVLQHQLHFGLADSTGAGLGIATIHAVRAWMEGVGDMRESPTSTHWLRSRVGVSLGVAWPSGIVAATDQDPSLVVSRFTAHTVVLASVRYTIEARIMRSAAWVGFSYEAAVPFGPPPIEMTTTTPGMHTGYAGFAPRMISIMLAWRR
ncbi:MAG: hypothetical protein HYR74_00910, partial [Candidatus Eisenbacteria bacterium]|nr:hypothetical protein [Candidatus Eisenbacteria bacterium]